MIKPKISVIIPVYNVELYIDRCIKSVTCQTYTNLEILLVDDGSTDNCPTICDEWEKRDTRINVIHKKNGGLSDARNAGLSVATGELVGFVDSDDWISPEMYQFLYEDMVKNNSDISACGVKLIWDDDSFQKNLTPKGNYVLNHQEAMEAIISESILKQPVWYKLYKVEVIRGIFFPIGRYNEDVFWSYQAIGNASKVSVFDTPCYYYFQRKDSIMGKKYSLKRLDALDAKLERLKYVAKKFPDLEKLAKWDLWFSSMYAMQLSLMFLPSMEYEFARHKIENITKSIANIRSIKGMSFKQKIWLYLSKFSFEKTCKLRNRLKIGL